MLKKKFSCQEDKLENVIRLMGKWGEMKAIQNSYGGQWIKYVPVLDKRTNGFFVF